VTDRIVFLHSALGDGRSWERQRRLLADRFEVVTPDLPGFGSEPVPTEEFSFVDRIAGLLPAILVGNSFGGGIALRTALAHPDGVPKLVLVDAGLPDHDWSSGPRAYWDEEEAVLERGDVDAAVELTLRTWALPEVRDSLREPVRRSYELQAAVPEPKVRWPELPPLSELRAETLVVVGERDFEDFRTIGQRIVREAPIARLEIVTGAGHVPSLEQPEAFDRLLLEFLEHGV
jgi:pimeloyl-ACP methyl ester carboxylesterase